MAFPRKGKSTSLIMPSRCEICISKQEGSTAFQLNLPYYYLAILFCYF